MLRAARTRLPPGEAELLMAHVLQRSAAWLFAYGDAELEDAQAAAFLQLLERRIAGAPVAYLLGRRGFWRFDLAVTPATLIPRPETERLVELALERLPAQSEARVLDLGTGSGAIALALAFERPRCRVVATDVSADALAVASSNARALGLGNLDFRHGDWWRPVAHERFALVASNPPYIADDDPHLAQGDLPHEPRQALASGADGLDALRTIAHGAGDHLEAGGWLLVEHGWQQGAAVRALFEAAGLCDVHTAQDLEGRDRVTLGRRG